MKPYFRHAQTRQSQTPQSEPIFTREKEMVKNSAGGYAFPVDDWKRLERFLILGSEGGSYYINERKLTLENAQAVINCIQADGRRVVNTVADISLKGRAPKNDQALFVLAMCLNYQWADTDTRQAAAVEVPKVARTGTHIMQLAGFIKLFRGWGRVAKRAVREWFNQKSVDALAYQAIKYQQREGWTLRDLLRVSHPKTVDEKRKRIYRRIAHPDHVILEEHALFRAVHEIKAASIKEAVDLIIKYQLPREAVPTELLNAPEIWEALLVNMPVTATIRNLGKMTSIGVLKPLSAHTGRVVNRITDVDILKKGRVHPLALLLALRTYSQGHGFRGKLEWDPVPEIEEALDRAFYLAFEAVEPTGKRFYLGVDVSGSMSAPIAGTPLSCAEAAGALAMVTVSTEPRTYVRGFSDAGLVGLLRQAEMIDLGIRKGNSLSEVHRQVQRENFGATDCALPMIDALEQGLEVDCFMILTDNETWVGDIHPVEALQRYRNQTGIPAKLVVLAMTSNGFSIADPNDAGMLDIVGFDTSVPAVIAEFVKEP